MNPLKLMTSLEENVKNITLKLLLLLEGGQKS